MMDNKDLISVDNKDLVNKPADDHSQLQTETGKLQREIDSLDDFERLEHETFQPHHVRNETMKFLDNLRETSESPPRVVGEIQQEINTGVESVLNSAVKTTQKVEQDPFDPHPVEKQSASSVPAGPVQDSNMDSNLLEMGDAFDNKKEEKIESFMSDLFPAPPTVPPHADNLAAGKLDVGDHNFEDFLSSSPNAAPHEVIDSVKANAEKYDEKFEKYSDFSDHDDDFGTSDQGHAEEHFTNLVKSDAPLGFANQFESHGLESFQDVRNDSPQPPLPKRDYFDIQEDKLSKSIVPNVEPIDIPTKSTTPEKKEQIADFTVKPPEKASSPPVVEEKKPEASAPIESQKLIVEEKKQEIKKETPPEPVKAKPKPAVIEAEAMFCKMGLDAWFNPQRLDPKVESLIYWRDPKISGAVFGGILAVLLSLAYFSLISVAAHLSLLILTGTISFRIYKNILQAVQKTADGHPFKEFLDADIALPQDKVKEVSEIAVAHINAAVAELRRLFLVEDLVDSIKFGVLLWCFTYLGAWFNGMTLIIIAFVALFTLPKVYETNKTQIDANLDIVRTKLADITSKVKAAVPIGKKTEEKKDQ